MSPRPWDGLSRCGSLQNFSLPRDLDRMAEELVTSETAKETENYSFVCILELGILVWTSKINLILYLNSSLNFDCLYIASFFSVDTHPYEESWNIATPEK